MLPRLAAGLDRGLAGLLAALLAAIVLAVSWQAVSRYLLADPSGWTEELARFLLIWIGLFGGAFAYHRRLHLGLDLLPEYLRTRATESAIDPTNPTNPMTGTRIDPTNPLTGTKIAKIVRRMSDACVLVFALTVLVGGGGALVALTFGLAQFSPALGLPMGAVYLSLPLSGFAMAVSAFAAIASPEDARQPYRSTD